MPREIEMKIITDGMLELDFSFFEAFQQLDLLAFVVRQQEKSPTAVVMFALVASDMFAETEVFRYKHGLFQLAEVHYPGIIFGAFRKPALHRRS